jgi:hypothetical protein
MLPLIPLALVYLRHRWKVRQCQQRGHAWTRHSDGTLECARCEATPSGQTDPLRDAPRSVWG